jgi:Thaumatin family
MRTKLGGLIALGLLASMAGAAGAATPAAYTGGVVTFSNQMPTGVLVYKCVPGTSCGQQTQLTNSGYMTNIPPMTTPSGATLDPAPMAFLYATGSYVLWQQQKSNASAWNSCKITINPVTGPDLTPPVNLQGNCTGLVWSNGPGQPPPEFANCGTSGHPPCDPIVSLNLYNNDGYTMPDGSTYAANPTLTSPTNPRTNQPTFASRTFTVIYAGRQAEICLNVVGTFNASPCSGDPNDIKVKPGAKNEYVFTYGGAQNLGPATANGTYVANSVFVVSGIKFSGQKAFTAVGQVPGMTDYGSRFEFAFYPQAMPASSSPGTFNGGTLSTGVSTVDMSLVNGYNFAFRLYPTQATICALGQEEMGPNHYFAWARRSVMSSFPESVSAPKPSPRPLNGVCPAAQVVSVTDQKGGSRTAGCQSDGTYAANTNASNAAEMGCTGSYGTPQTCPPPASDPAPYGYTPPTAIPRPFADLLGLGKHILKNAYTWPYEDFRGTFTCDGNAQNYTLEIDDLPGKQTLAAPK